MLASRLCVLDDKTDSKSKWVKKAPSVVVLSGLSIQLNLWRFRSVMLCRNLKTMHAKWMYHALTQGIRRMKTFTMYKKCYCWWKYHKNTRSSVECWDHCDKTQHQLPIFCQNFQFCCCKIEIVWKIKWLFPFRRVWLISHWC